jgi:hypothetical protein
MTKTLFAYAAAASLSVATLATPTSAQAGNDGAVVAGVIGGLAVGAMIGSAAAGNNGPRYQPAPVYYGAGYYGSGYPGCYLQRQRVWDGYTWRMTRVRVCN